MHKNTICTSNFTNNGIIFFERQCFKAKHSQLKGIKKAANQSGLTIGLRLYGVDGLTCLFYLVFWLEPVHAYNRLNELEI